MDWDLPVGVNLPADNQSVDWRIAMFFGHFDARIYLTDAAYVDIGAGSMGCEARVTMVRPDFAGCLGTIGRFCAVADCAIMAFGEHANDRPVNIGMSGAPLFNSFLKASGQSWAKESPPFEIGSGVLVSSGAKIVPGRKIGDGSVVGAGAVVTSDIGEFGIYAGVPARLIKNRDRFAPWWDFHPAYMAELLAAGQLDDAARRPDGHRYWRDRPRLAYRRNKDASLEVLGRVNGDVITPIADEPDPFKRYVEQAFGPGPYVWWADPWSA